MKSNEALIEQSIYTQGWDKAELGSVTYTILEIRSKKTTR